MTYTYIFDYSIGDHAGWAPAGVYTPSFTAPATYPRPRSNGIQYPEQRYAGNGGLYDVGRPFIEWEFTQLTRAELVAWRGALYLNSARSAQILVNGFFADDPAAIFWFWYKAWVDRPIVKRNPLGAPNVIFRFRDLVLSP